MEEEEVVVKEEPEEQDSEEKDDGSDWSSSLTRDLQDVFPKVEVKTEDEGDNDDCPESLQIYTDDEISNAFRHCYNRKSNLKYSDGKSLFAKILTFLTGKKSNLKERRYLYDLWSLKYKHQLWNPLKNIEKSRRAKYRRRIQKEQQRILDSVKVENDTNCERQEHVTYSNRKVRPRTRQKLSHPKGNEELTESDHDQGNDYLFSGNNKVSKTKSRVLINGRNNADKSICSVCGRPLRRNYISFHMRTHLSLEEHKVFVNERMEKERKIRQALTQSDPPYRDPGKNLSSENRLDKLKWLLEGLEKKYNKKTHASYDEEKDTNEKRKHCTPGHRKTEKRNGNYGPVQCTFCGKVISTIYKLKEHEAQVHKIDEKLFPCSICDRPFPSKDSCNVHLRSHLNFEERTQFATWPGGILEYIERLNTGEDLNEPPTKPLRNLSKCRTFPFRKLPKRKIGCPRKQRKRGGNICSQETTTGSTESPSTNLNASNSLGVNLSMSTFASSNLDAKLSWNLNLNQATGTHNR